MAFVQFVAEIKFSELGDSRQSRLIRAQRLSKYLYDLLAAQSSITMPRPAGGTQGFQTAPSFSHLASGMRYVPQFGQQPARLIITAINNITGDLPKPYDDALILSHGDYYTGQLDTPAKIAVSNLTASFNTVVYNLATTLRAAITSLNNTHDADASLFRLEYAGINYGGLVRGYHFPRS